MKITNVMGLTRVRNEETIMQETLDHFAEVCDAGILVLDDCSTDGTPDISRGHRAVRRVLYRDEWRADRLEEEWRHRQELLEAGREYGPKWFLYFDADERVECELRVPHVCDSVSMRLFDAYITEEDKDEVGCHRKWFGPEYREIIMLFRNMPWMNYHLPDQRIVDGFRKPYPSGYVRHYGKAVSIQEWEDTCDYYVKHFPEPYKEQWAARKGHAVHTESDFARPLIEWHERDKKAVCIGTLPTFSPGIVKATQ